MAAALQSFIDSSSPSQGKPIHAHIIKSGHHSSTSISIKLLILHLKCGSLNNARKVFDEMTKPTVSAFNYLISGYFRAGITEKCLELARKLSFSGEKPDGFTLSMVLRLSAAMVSFNLAKQTHSQIIKSELWYDDFLFAALIDSYVKNGMIGYARSIFDALPRRSLVCSTALIVGYMNQNSFKDAEEVFRCLVQKDDVVYNAMIEGYSKLVEKASRSFEVYKEMRFEGYKPTISTAVSVIGACSLLSEKNVFSWTSMIDGYGKNGISEEALKLFNKMRTCSDVKPNHTTFLSVLSACGHAGLVSGGKEIFESMEKDHGLQPRMEHYACMVDLLGRADRLLEAYDFIKRIPEKPNSDVWGALLGASRVHGHVAMADIAAMELFKLCRNERPGAYLALSNTFAAAGRWDGVFRVREMMKERRVSKNAGYSWVDSEEGLHGFHFDEISGRSAL
ncbi:Pentatricopeptide repeat-containing protein [Dendrobium catenatum]|uniref:Pentatricopeptide repeat-containing protein n=1 Tax=Dendrobium catenatum TaxID=906689 RepID=A0A2I0WRW1_9ASPA|nr:Pentatricopeptide repeat-containing protein [Dendrobium catenatum]